MLYNIGWVLHICRKLFCQPAAPVQRDRHPVLGDVDDAGFDEEPIQLARYVRVDTAGFECVEGCGVVMTGQGGFQLDV
ncbi:hypothetical protein BC936DRAFT_139910 [Jimgerdemannia flammicorona]|uniref:Uncharacterized protein n=1 Tax=Jimgerdemannia flammicorona TaxID=994334 RepID=A0A433B925_9FUNG|nr:hypothetical protein BC936DRAFT_139910 [Jimgerdemannia flammicorona]